MNETILTNVAEYPPQKLCWGDYLYIFGMFVFAIACNFSIAASQTGLSLALIGFIGLYRQGRVNICRTPLDKPFMFLFATAILSTFRANESFIALREMKTFMIIFVFYLAYWPRMTEEFQNKLLNTFIFFAALVSVVNNYKILLGLAEAKHAKGFFSMSITFGECMALSGLAAMLKLAMPAKNKKCFFFYFGAFLLIFVSMIQSLTRGAWLGLIAGSAVMTLRFPRRMLPLVLAVGVLITTVALQHPDFKERLIGFSLTKTIEMAKRPMSMDFESIGLFSNLQRLYIWLRGFEMTDNAFIFGVGADNVKTHYKRLAGEFEHRLNLIWGHQHNNFMQMFAMYGILGLVAFFYFITVTIKFLLSARPDPGNHHAIGAIAIFSGFLFFGFTEYCWGDEEVIMIAMFLNGVLMNRNVSVALPAQSA